MQEREVVAAVVNGSDRKAKADSGDYAVVGAGRLQTHGGTEGKSSKDHWKVELTMQPVERGADIFNLATAVVVLSLAQSCSAKVEAQHGETEAVQSFRGVENDFVVKRSPINRMRMADQRGVGRVRRALVEQGFKAPGRSFKEQRPDRGSFVRHKCIVQPSLPV